MSSCCHKRGTAHHSGYPGSDLRQVTSLFTICFHLLSLQWILGMKLATQTSSSNSPPTVTEQSERSNVVGCWDVLGYDVCYGSS
jgi:hypothetical protein